jgi:integral membrane sensor domain MASE1
MLGSAGKTSNPLAPIGVLTGAIGSAFSVILWVHHFQPETAILGQYSSQIVYGNLGDQLQLLAALFGLMGIIAGIAGGLGGNGTAGTVASLLLGIVGVSYPALSYLNLLEGFVPNPV